MPASVSLATINLILSASVADIDFFEKESASGSKNLKTRISLFAPSIFAISKISRSIASIPPEKAEYAVGIITISDTIMGAYREPSQMDTISVTAIVGIAREKLTKGARIFFTVEKTADKRAKERARITLIKKDIAVR